MPSKHLRWVSLVGLALLVACSPGAPYRGATLYAGFTHVDPRAETSTPDTWLVVENGEILEMGTGATPHGDFATVHDLSGLFGMPGLIDAHAHVTSGPFESGIENGAPWVGIRPGARTPVSTRRSHSRSASRPCAIRAAPPTRTPSTTA